MSTHTAPVVPIIKEKHPDADTLSVVRIGGYTVCIKTADWEGIDKAIYIEPDTLVDTNRPEFGFLKKQAYYSGWARVKCMKMRNITSMGFLIPAPPDAQIGDDYWNKLNLDRYEPENEKVEQPKVSTSGEDTSAPNIPHLDSIPKYDVENLRRYQEYMEEGELVHVTEKLDGSNWRGVYWDNKFHIGSRTLWKKEFPTTQPITVDELFEKMRAKHPEQYLDDLRFKAEQAFIDLKNRPVRQVVFWQAFNNTPGIKELLMKYPGFIFYGECFGNAGRIKYSSTNTIKIFDILTPNGWLDIEDLNQVFADNADLQVPSIGTIAFNFNQMELLSEGSSFLNPNCIREGIVITPMKNRYGHCGRIKFKLVSSRYLAMK